MTVEPDNLQTTSAGTFGQIAAGGGVRVLVTSPTSALLCRIAPELAEEVATVGLAPHRARAR